MTECLRVRFDLSYEGTEFAGWAMQPGQRTVEGTLTDALRTVLRLPILRLTVAGRTDAGVHASAQVAHADIERAAWQVVPGRSVRNPEVALMSRLRGVLPKDVVVQRVSVAPDGFDARFSALHRQYKYRIADLGAPRNPMSRRFVHWHRRELDVVSMNLAAKSLEGEHDFRAYCRPREGATTVRTLQRFVWERLTQGRDAGLVVATVQADAFCHNMVRALVGGSIVVGEGRAEISWVRDVLDARLRDARAEVMPARGLTLERVAYPADSELGARARVTRNRRD